MNRTFRLSLFLILLLLISHVPSYEVFAYNTQTFQAYQTQSIGILPYFILTVKPYLRVNGSSPGEYRLLYAAYPSFSNITSWTFEYVNLTELPGATRRCGNVTLPGITNRFNVFTYHGTPVLHWWADNNTVYDYFLDTGVPVVIRYKPIDFQLTGRVEGEYVVFSNLNTTLEIPVKELSKYYPRQLLNDLVGMMYHDVIYIWNDTSSSYVTRHRECFLIYPRRLSYWKADGRVYVGVNFSNGVELGANQSIPILIYSKGMLKPVVDVLKLITPRGDPLRNLKNPVIAQTPQIWVTPAGVYDIRDERYLRYVLLNYSAVSNGTSVVLIVTVKEPGWIPYRYPYLVEGGTPKFFNLSPTWSLSGPWWLYKFEFGVWREHYELLWDKFPPRINTTRVYFLNGTCWVQVSNTSFHASKGFVAEGIVEGDYMVFPFNGTTLEIPLSELAKYYPPRIWKWRLSAAKDNEGYLILPAIGFNYGNYYYMGGGSGSIFGMVWTSGDFLLPVDNSSGIYALYYINGTLRPAFDLLRLIGPDGDFIRTLPTPRSLPNPYFNSSVAFGLCNAVEQQTERVNTSTVTVGENITGVLTDKEKDICGPGLVLLLSAAAIALKRLRDGGE